MAGNQDLENSDIKVALLILFNNQEVLDMLFTYYPLCHTHQFSCIIAQTIALSKCFVNKQPMSLEALKSSVILYLKNIDMNFEYNTFINPIEIISAILVNFHCFGVSGSCYNDEEIVLMSCQKKCILHKIFFLDVEKDSACKCGRKWISNSDDNICQNLKTESIFEYFNEDVSRIIGILPKYKFRDPQIIGNSAGFYKKISNFLTIQLERIILNACENITCGYSEVSVSFKVKDLPKVYIIDISYHAGDFKHLKSFLMTISIEDKITLKDIYKQGQSEDYGLDGVVFFGIGYFYAKFNGEFWEFPGLHPEAGWYELIQEALVMKMHPVSLIFKKGLESKISELNNYKLLKLEQSAAQCDLFVENFNCPFIPEKQLSSGYFAEKNVNADGEGPKILETNQSSTNEILLSGWNCQCGQQNLYDFDVCTKCEELKPGVSGWLCKNCHCKNDDVSRICSACYEINKDLKSKYFKEQEYSEHKSESGNEIQESDNGDWTCECECKNTKDFDICQECYKLKPGIDGWVCKACKGKNEELEYKCGICETFKSGNFKPDQAFWVCEKCKSAISAKYNYCDKCLLSEPSRCYSSAGLQSKYQVCTNCNKKSPTSTFKCYWCGELFDKTSELEEPSKKGLEWECRICSFENTSNYYNCENCKEKRTAFGVEENKQECPDCRRLISPGMEKCIFCALSKTSNSQSFDEDDDRWECSQCSVLNESWRVRCFKCFNENNIQTKPYYTERSFDNTRWSCNSCLKKNTLDVEICKYCSTRKAERQGFNSTMNKYCLGCKKEIEEVLCKKCKKLTKVSDMMCQICNSDVSNVYICGECATNPEEDMPERLA